MMTQTVYADLHIHLGQSETGKPIKITASKNLTLRSMLEHASAKKGMQMIGMIDSHVPEVLAELKHLIRTGQAAPCSGGGIDYQGVTLILGTEMEIYDQNCSGPIHVLCYFPTIEEMSHFSQFMAQYQKNISLSSQRSYVNAKQLQLKVKELDGLFIPAHIFTPFKSMYGKGVKKTLIEVFDPLLVDAVELGLSADTVMAVQLPELHTYPFVTNSDAHSVSKIGREYMKLRLSQADYVHLRKALKGESEQRLEVNYGLDPKLGKYHREVSQRIKELGRNQIERIRSNMTDSRILRPDYTYQIPLEFIPGLGPKMLRTLLEAFGSEMNVIHHTTGLDLERYVPKEVAKSIVDGREGKLELESGGAGKYGKVKVIS